MFWLLSCKWLVRDDGTILTLSRTSTGHVSIVAAVQAVQAVITVLCVNPFSTTYTKTTCGSVLSPPRGLLHSTVLTYVGDISRMYPSI